MNPKVDARARLLELAYVNAPESPYMGTIAGREADPHNTHTSHKDGETERER